MNRFPAASRQAGRERAASVGWGMMEGARKPPTAAIIASLAGVEGRKLVGHPFFLGGVAFALIGSGRFVRASLARPGVTWDHDGWTVAVGFFLLGISTMVAANHAALRDRREHAEEQHSMLPVGAPTRTMGLLAAMLWPVTIAAVLLAAVVGFAASKGIVVDDVEVVHLVEGISTILMLGAMGIAIAAWLPSPFVTPVLGWTLFLVTPGNVPQSWHSLAPFARMRSTELAMLHLTYLGGLTAIFALIALARSSRFRSLLLPVVIATAIVIASGTILLVRACSPDGTCLV